MNGKGEEDLSENKNELENEKNKDSFDMFLAGKSSENKNEKRRSAVDLFYSELDDDEDEVLPVGTKSRHVSNVTEKKKPKVADIKRKQQTSIKRKMAMEPDEDDDGTILEHRGSGPFTEYKICHGEGDEAWIPEAQLTCYKSIIKYLKKQLGIGDQEENYEKIVERREKPNGVFEFKVRWKDWSAKFDTWQQEEDLNCPELIEMFLQENTNGKRKKGVEEEEEQVDEDDDAETKGKKGKNMKKGTEKKSTNKKLKGDKKNVSFKSDDDEVEKDKGSDEKEEEDDYQVEEIIAMRKHRGKQEYLVKWFGWGRESNTWEPESNLTGCPELLQNFKDAQLQESSKEASSSSDQKEQKQTKPARRGAGKSDVPETMSRQSRRGPIKSYVYNSDDD